MQIDERLNKLQVEIAQQTNRNVSIHLLMPSVYGDSYRATMWVMFFENESSQIGYLIQGENFTKCIKKLKQEIKERLFEKEYAHENRHHA